mmetsp:Transcript_46238/g.110004  ORF Transcript_46238/g.110004 Transcript_46238/m.110004 type:complete len:651 (+) Transcript_46238:85-2037(+)
MLAPYLWLSPTATDVLRSISQALKGASPCGLDALTGALQGGEAEGLLSDASLCTDFVAELKASGIKEINDGAAARLVEVFGAVLTKRASAAKTAAGKIAKGLPSGKYPTYGDIVALLPKGEKPSPALKGDWVLWHQLGNAHDAKSLPALPEAVLKERLSLAACAGSGFIATALIALHVLENVDAYVAWEKSLGASQPPPATAGVLVPFDEQTCNDVAMRRVLNSILPQETSTRVVAAAGKTGSLTKGLKQLSDEVCKAAALPLYVAPVSKEPKEPRQKKEKEAPADAGKGKEAAPSGGEPAFDELVKATQSQELHWSLLSYALNPGTILSKAAASGSSEKSSKPAAAAKPGAAAASNSMAFPPGTTGNKFTRVWVPAAGQTPGGHTESSWYPTKVNVNATDFKTTWAGTMPAGHTEMSWSKGAALSSASAATASSPSAAPAPAAAGKEKAKAAAPKPAAAKAASSASASGGAAPEEGSVEAALCKLDLRCGRILDCQRVPDADSLYLLKINVGDPAPRQVVSSLVKHYKAEDLQNRPVVVYCNIKPGKMRGFESQAMVLAATKDKGSEEEKCELLTPPEGVSEGTTLVCGSIQVGSTSASVSVKNISKVWGQVQPLLLTNGTCEATFNSTTLTAEGKPVKCNTLTDVGIY